MNTVFRNLFMIFLLILFNQSSVALRQNDKANDLVLGERLKKSLLESEAPTQEGDVFVLNFFDRIIEFNKSHIDLEFSRSNKQDLQESFINERNTILSQLERIKGTQFSAREYLGFLSAVHELLKKDAKEEFFNVFLDDLLVALIPLYNNFSHKLLDKSRNIIVNFHDLKNIANLTSEIRVLLDQELHEIASPHILRNFDDLSQDLIRDIANSLKTFNSKYVDDQFDHLTEKERIEQVIRDLLPVDFREDKAGNLYILFTGEFGFRDSYYSLSHFLNFNNITYSKAFGLNGDYKILEWAEQAYRKLIKHNLLDRVENYLRSGRRVRLIGHGTQGSAAELIAFRLKQTFSPKDRSSSKDALSDDNQIQAITFGTSGYLSLQSVQKTSGFNMVMKGNNLRFRLVTDSLAEKPYRQAAKNHGDIFRIPHVDKSIIPDALASWHLLKFYWGNLTNVGVLQPFRAKSAFYSALSSENDVLNTLVTSVAEIKKANEPEKVYAAISDIETSFLNLNGLRSAITSRRPVDRARNAEIIGYAETLIKTNKISDKTEPPPEIHRLLLEHQNKIDLLDKQTKEGPKELQKKFELLNNYLDVKELNSTQFNDLIRFAKSDVAAFILFDRQNDEKISKLLANYLVLNEREINKKEIEALDDEESARREKYLQALAQGKLAFMLGRGYESAGGTTGSLLVKDIHDRFVGVFKSRGINGFFKENFGQASALSKDQYGQPHSEVAAYQLSRLLDFKIAPISMMIEVEIEGKKRYGAFMEFLHGYRPTDENTFDGTYTRKETYMFQLMTVFDYIIGNYDRFLDNLFYKKGKGISELICIDNANAFPRKGPNKFNGHHMYLWTDFAGDLAHQPFTTEIKEFVNKISIDKLKLFINDIEARYQLFFTTESKDFLYQRLALLKHMAQSAKELDTPYKLGHIKSRSSIDKLLIKETKN